MSAMRAMSSGDRSRRVRSSMWPSLRASMNKVSPIRSRRLVRDAGTRGRRVSGLSGRAGPEGR